MLRFLISIQSILFFLAPNIIFINAFAENKARFTNQEQSSLSANPISLSSHTPFKLPTKYKKLFHHYRDNWSRVTGFEFSGLHWKQFVVVFTNKGSDTYKQNYFKYLKVYQNFDDEDEDESDEEDETEKFDKYPVGTVFIKENYTANNLKPETPLTLTIMIKHEEGYDNKGGNWEYIQSDASGKILLQGNGEQQQVKKICSECHANVAERDYIFSTFYSPPNTLNKL